MDVWFSAAGFVETGDCFGRKDAHGYVLRDEGFVGRGGLEGHAIAAAGGVEDVVVVEAAVGVHYMIVVVGTCMMVMRGGWTTAAWVPALDGCGDCDDEVGDAVALCEADGGGGGV